MKIAVAKNNSQTVAGYVGGCKVFLVYETEKLRILNMVARINSFTHRRQHLEEHHRHHNLINGLKDCDALIFNHGGWRLIEDLKAHNIKPILTNKVIAEDAVYKW